VSRAVTLAGYAVLAVLVVAWEVAARRSRRHAMLADFAGAVAATPARWLLLAGWLWVGWHVFARVDWR